MEEGESFFLRHFRFAFDLCFLDVSSLHIYMKMEIKNYGNDCFAYTIIKIK